MGYRGPSGLKGWMKTQSKFWYHNYGSGFGHFHVHIGSELSGELLKRDWLTLRKKSKNLIDWHYIHAEYVNIPTDNTEFEGQKGSAYFTFMVYRGKGELFLKKKFKFKTFLKALCNICRERIK